MVVLLAASASVATAPPVAAQVPAAALPPTVELPPELDRVLRDYEEGWRNRDAAALAELFAPDGYVLRPGYRPAMGRAAIREAYATSGGPLFLRAFDYAVEGTVGYILGGYSGREGSPDSGKFILTLLRGDDGRWLIVADMDNGN
ncbi:MAG: nuclear transport factor 2 family protein [Gemmatimonadetes bacterium]|nr:nuclear transport factor 2 family protein [Gemmatimonadota bacterium]